MWSGRKKEEKKKVLDNWQNVSLDEIFKLMKTDEALKEDHHMEELDNNQHAWYQDCTRTVAEKLLKKAGAADGLFLIRPNKSSEGDYVLSVCCGGVIKHYIIKQQAPLINKYCLKNETVIHGLDEWVKHYRSGSASEPRLTEFCKKGTINIPPPHVRKTGYTNLLHRSILEGKPEYSRKILQNSKIDVNSKNSNGSTVLHDACRKGMQEVVSWLIVPRKANMTARDIDGFTPLQVACIEDQPVVAKQLILEGADPDERNFDNNSRVALHEAAALGHIHCVKVLLALDASVWIMDNKSATGTTPHDLARGHKVNIEDLLENATALPAQVNKSDWYHGDIDKQECEKLLLKHSMHDGTFLVRDSTRSSGSFVLCLVFQKKVKSFKIVNKSETFYYLQGEGDRLVVLLPSLEHLVQYYALRADCIPCSLTQAIKPGSTKAIPIQINSIKKRHNLNSLDFLKKMTDAVKSKPPSPKKRHVNYSTVQKTRTKFQEIPREAIVLSYEIGQGEFGSVYKGLWRYTDEVDVDVAIKTLNEEVSSGRESFLQEAKIMVELDHPCIVRLIGVCEGTPLMLIQELMPLGAMLDYLLDYPEKIDRKVELYLWAMQIAEGMNYLETKGFVHRDLAARNIMLENTQQVKVGDFGLSRAVGADSEYYKASAGGRWPVKWYAPEAVLYGHFSSASDVWSYGVTLWEMFTFGDQPYEAMTGSQVLETIEKGKRLDKPDECPDQIYEIMHKCWSYKSEDRPTFEVLKGIFSTDSEYASTRELTRRESRC